MLERGRAMRQTLGVPTGGAVSPGLEQDYQDFINRYVFGEVWCRPGLDLRLRSAITVATLVAQGRSDQLVHHIKAALVNGVTPQEIREIIFHQAAYCGVILAAVAFKVADEILGPYDPVDNERAC
jgi:3-oxoadipate enol-lactonase / 4-carboxymuconolactone decarboxylase